MPVRVSSWQGVFDCSDETVAPCIHFLQEISLTVASCFERHSFPWSDDGTDSHLAIRVVEELNFDSLKGISDAFRRYGPRRRREHADYPCHYWPATFWPEGRSPYFGSSSSSAAARSTHPEPGTGLSCMRASADASSPWSSQMTPGRTSTELPWTFGPPQTMGDQGLVFFASYPVIM